MPEEEYVLKASTVQFINEHEKAIRAVMKLRDAGKQGAKGLKEQKDEGSKLGDTLEKMGRSMLAFGASTLSIRKGLELLKQYHAALKSVSSASDQAATSSMGLTVMKGPAVVKELSLQAARQGVKMEEILPIAEELYGGYAGRPEMAKRGVAENLRLFNLKIPTEGVRAINKLATDPTLGLTPEQASSIVIEAGRRSQLPTSAIAELAGGIGMYERPEVGAAALVAMTKTSHLERGELPTYLRRAAQALQTGEGDYAELMRRRAKKSGVDWEKLDTVEKLQMTRDLLTERRLPMTDLSLEKIGIKEQREKRGVLALLPHTEQIRKDAADLAKTPTDLSQRLLQEAYANPALWAEFVNRAADATRAAENVYGKIAPVAREQEFERRELGASLREKYPGLATVFTDEVGAAGDATYMLDKYTRPFEGMGILSGAEPPPPPDTRPADTRLLERVDRLIEIMEQTSAASAATAENTAATADNTAQTGVAEYVPMAARNAGIE